MHFKLGRLPFVVDSSHAVGALVTREFASARVSEHGEPSMVVSFRDQLPTLDQYSVLAPVTVANDRYQVDEAAFSYQVEHQAGRPLHLIVAPGTSAPSPSHLLPAGVRRFLDWTYLTDDARSAKHFVYEMFDYLSQIAQLKVGQTLLHASAVGHGDSATVFAAWGGIGKTSAMLQLVMRHGCRFLADDLAVVDRSGIVYRHPKRMQVYAYNLVDMPELTRALRAQQSPLDKVSWRLHRRL